MAEKRMFSKAIIDSDAFLDMPLSTQSLYFHLGMRGDDYGFINNPKKITRMVGANEDELKLLIVKKFILDFDNGVIVIKHWNIHNNIRKDRLKPTTYTRELETLYIKDNGTYGLSETLPSIVSQVATTCQPDANQETTFCQHSIDKVRLEEVSIDKSSVTTSKSYDDSVRIANYLFKNILKVNPSHKKPNINNWAKDIDLAIRIDGRTVNQLKECIDWIYKTECGSFWKKNILSGAALRNKFDRMNMQVISKVKTKKEKQLSQAQQTTYNYMKSEGYSDDDIKNELEKIK